MKLQGILAVLLFLSTSLKAASGPQGFHGMLVFGQEQVYVSHLPMFHPLHKYQGIWRAHFETLDGEKIQNYQEFGNGLKATGPEQYYTVAPTEDFFLPDLKEKKKSFTAQLVHGHFERPGKVVKGEVVVVLDKLIHFHEFKLNQLPLPQLEYFLVGHGNEWFAVHLISTSPSFDQVLEVQAQKEFVLGAFITLNKPDSTPLNQLQTLKANLEIEGIKEPTSLKVLEILYTEVGELVGTLPAQGGGAHHSH